MISNLIIKKFRSIENLAIRLGPINAFVGPNNSGKSNIMQALNLILGETYPSIRSFDGRDFHDYDKTTPIEIEVRFDQPLTTNPRVWGFHLGHDGNACDYLAIDQNGNILTWPSGREIHVSNEMRDEVALMYLGLDRQAYQQIRVTQWTIYGKLLKHIETMINAGKRDAFKSDVENAYETNIAPDLRPFIDSTKEFVMRQTGLDLGFRLSSVDPIETLKNLRPYFQEQNIDIEFDAEEVGAGVQSALAVAIARAYTQIVRKSLLMAIEEPELYLHPHGCRHFYKLLCELSTANVQIIYATHERAFVNVLDYQNVHLVRKRDGHTYVKCGIDLTLTPSETTKVASKFDDVMNEVFCADHVVLVEGVDKVPVQLALEKQGVDIDKDNISITECGGRGAMKDISMILKHFEIPTYIIVDEDPGNPVAQRENQELINLVGQDNVFLQSPNLETVFGLPNKPSKKEALEIFPPWFEQNDVLQVYVDLKQKMFGV